MNGVQVVREGNETRIVFEPVLDITSARNLYSELEGALTVAAPLTLDASRVERVDAATLQVLAAFCRAVRAANIEMHWQSISPSLREAAALFDLDEMLGKKQ